MSMAKRSRTSLRLCWLESFLEVIANDGIEVRAAEKLGISAPQVNRDLASLQWWLQRPLFVLGTPRELTEFGDAFAATARTVVDSLKSAQADLRATRPEPKPPYSPKL